MTAAHVAAAVAGRLEPASAGDLTVAGPVVVDSRAAGPGSVFAAVRGERADGFDFVAAAAAAGAVLALATRPAPELPTVVVDDVVAALGLLARASLDGLPDVEVVAVTGSSGKTTTKDLLASVLSRAGETVAPPGSYNNEIGLPLTVLAAGPKTRFLVLEMGARGVGQLRALTGTAPPGVGVVLNVGTAHLGEFGSRESIALAKGELVEALPPGGLAVLNADDPMVLAMADRTVARVETFGRSEAAHVRAEDVELDAGRPTFRLVAPTGTADVALRLVGEHQVANALAAAAVALHEGMSVADVAVALTEAEPVSRWRMEVTDRPDGVTVVNDAYNANPESMRAALKALVALGAGGRRTWAVLGEMRELGPDSIAEHDALGRLAVRLDVRRLVVVGEGARPMHLGAGMEGSWGDESVFVPDADAAVALLRAELRPGDVVLVKASRAAGLERVAEALLEGVPR